MPLLYRGISTFRQAPWASCQIRNIACCACAGIAGTFSHPPRISDPDMHHGTCVTHVPWWMQGSLTSRLLWSRFREKRSRLSRRIRNPQFNVSDKRPMPPSCYPQIFWFVQKTVYSGWTQIIPLKGVNAIPVNAPVPCIAIDTMFLMLK